jgi:hypothetical protein
MSFLGSSANVLVDYITAYPHIKNTSVALWSDTLSANGYDDTSIASALEYAIDIVNKRKLQNEKIIVDLQK